MSVSGAQALGGYCGGELMVLANLIGVLVDFTRQQRVARSVLWARLPGLLYLGPG